MRKARILWVAAAALLVAAFAGCSMNADSMNVGVEQAGKNVVEAITVDVNITNLSDYDTVITEESAGNARTILPTFDADTANYDYYLYGISSTGVTFPKNGLSFTNVADKDPYGEGGKLKLDGDKFKITILPGLYDFTIFAVEKGAAVSAITSVATILSSASLVGYSTVDLTSGTGSVDFTLSPDGLTGNGKINLKVFLVNNCSSIADVNDTNAWVLPSGVTAKFELLNYITGESVSWAGTNDLVTSAPSFTTSADPELTTSSYAPFNGTGSQSVAPGTYTFMVTFTKDSKEIGCWSDTLVVLSQRTTNANVFVPEVLENIPGDVTSLKAVYIKNSEDNPRLGFYKVHFQWADSIVNERYYELQIADVTGNASIPLDDVAFTALDSGVTTYTLADDFTSTTVFLKAEERFAGSLLANNKDATVYLKLGHQYQARIRARNAIGPSENWTMLTIPTGGTGDTVTVPTAIAITDNTSYFIGAASAALKCINRFGITYNLNGGKYISKITPETWSNKNRVFYFCQDNSTGTVKAAALWDGLPDGLTPAPADAAERDAKLVQRSNISLKAWITDINDTSKIVYQYTQDDVDGVGKVLDTDFTADGYVGYKNVTLYADYNTGVMTGTVAIEDPTLYQLRYGWLNVVGGDTTTAYGNVKNKIKVSKTVASGTPSITVSMKLPNDEAVSATDSRKVKVDYDDSGTVVLEVRDSNNIIKKTDKKAVATGGTPFAAIEIKSWENGIYSFTFTATKTTSGKTIIRTLPLTVEITD